jgi:hypothetical protein
VLLPLGPELDCSQLGDQCSIHIPKTPLFGASDDPLWNFNIPNTQKLDT